jgi:hypothetical protein
MTGQLSPLAQGKATGYPSKLLKTGQTTQYDSELDDGYYEVGVARSYTVNTTGAQSGTTNVDLTHLVSDTGAFTAANKTYTDAGKCGVFKAAGGETIVISGSGNNNGVFTTASATADTVVFVEAITDEADAPLTTFKKREAISNNTVLDNNTGLTWLRYMPVLLGIAGDGKMPATGKVYDMYQYCAVANAASLGGHNDWRIPNINEVLSVVDFSGQINTTAFPQGLTGVIWTSTARANSPSANLVVSFWYNYVAYLIISLYVKTSANYVWLVRGGI